MMMFGIFIYHFLFVVYAIEEEKCNFFVRDDEGCGNAIFLVRKWAFKNDSFDQFKISRKTFQNATKNNGLKYFEYKKSANVLEFWKNPTNALFWVQCNKNKIILDIVALQHAVTSPTYMHLHTFIVGRSERRN